MVISAPPTTGLGAAARKPTAQVTVFTKAGGNLDQGSVVHLRTWWRVRSRGSKSGKSRSSTARRGGSFRAAAPGSFTATTYLEQAAKVEERIQNKIVEHLSPFIPNVIVSVNAIVDASRTESRTDSVLPKGEGTQSLLKSESSTTETSNDSSRAAEPGVGANIGLDINRAGSGGRSNTSRETSDTNYENIPGRKVETRIDAQGKPLKINVAVSVPKDYVTQVLAARSGAAAAGGGAGGNAPAAPSDADVEAAWATERPKLEAMLRPLIETEVSQAGGAAAGSASTGNLVISLIPVDMLLPASVGGGGNTAGIGGFLGGSGGAGGLLGNSLFKQIALGGLAAMSIGLMLLMVKVRAKPERAAHG